MKINININNLEHKIIRLFYACMLFLVLLQIFARYILGTPLGWTEELSRFSYVWLTFIGAGYCIKSNTNVKVMYFLNKLPFSIRQKIRIIGNSLVSVVLIYLLPSSIDFSVNMMRRKSPALEIPMFYVYISVVLGFVLIITRLSMESFEIYKEIKRGDSASKAEQIIEGGGF